MSWISTAGCMRARLPCEPEAKHELAHLDQRPVTMTGPVLFGKRHFREGLIGGTVNEHRVVTKTVIAARNRGNLSGQNAIGHQVFERSFLRHKNKHHHRAKTRASI